MSSLPNGFSVRLGRRTMLRESGTVLVGGSPIRVIRLKPAAASQLSGRNVVVADASSGALAELLMSSGIAAPLLASLPPVGLDELTVVVPVHDRAVMLERLLKSLPSGLRTVVVDDASTDAGAAQTVAARHGAKFVRLSENQGAAAARNAGLAHVRTTYVAFVDSDVVGTPGCFEALLRHFADPRLAVIAPRVRGLEQARGNWITRYEHARSSLDLGPDGGIVRPRSSLSWVSSTFLIARVDYLQDGFDPTMRVGEDVDLVWRMAKADLRVRYEPAVTVLHEHRITVDAWLSRKFFYGTGAAPLASRHPENISPAILAPWDAVLLIALLAQRRWSIPVAIATGGYIATRVATRIKHIEKPWPVALQLTGQSMIATLVQGGALLVRHWWPAAVVGAVASRRVRRLLLITSVVDALWEYSRLRPDLDPLRFTLARRLDDLAYGAGVWCGAWKERSIKPLLPAWTAVKRRRSTSSSRA